MMLRDSIAPCVDLFGLDKQSKTPNLRLETSTHASFHVEDLVHLCSGEYYEIAIITVHCDINITLVLVIKHCELRTRNYVSSLTRVRSELQSTCLP